MHFLRDHSYIISIAISIYFWSYFTITRGDWWMVWALLGFMQSALLIVTSSFQSQKIRITMKQGIDLKDAIDALTDLIIGKNQI